RRLSGRNGSGSSWPIVVNFRFPPAVASITRIPGENSASTWRHAPHGVGRGSSSMTMANAAVRTAHTVNPYEAFSTFAPLCTLFRLVRIAAPTLYFEYGAWARWRAS